MSKADRMPPFNGEAEEGVLGSILLDNDALHEVAPLLKVSDFFRDSHQVLYRRVLALYEAGEPVDAITVIEAMTTAETSEGIAEIDAIGGPEFVIQLLNDTPHAANAKFYAQIVREKARSREIIDAAIRVAKAGYANQHTAGELFALAESSFLAIGDTLEAEGVKRAKDAVTASMDAYGERLDGVRPGLPSGLNGLDQKIGGLRGGRLYVVAARPSIGKSSLVTTMLASVAEAGEPCLLFSLEMDDCELGDRLLCGESGVDGHRYTHPNTMIDDEHDAIARAAERVTALPLLIDDRSSRSIGQIIAISRRAVAREGVKLIAIDYLQLLQSDDPRSRQSRQEFIADTTRRLKNMAKDLRVPVILVSQLNRMAESTESKRPTMSQLRESGAIEQDANVVILLHRPDFYDPADEPGVSYLIVAKNRGGPTGDVKLGFRKGQTRFVDYDDGYEQRHTIPASEPFHADVTYRGPAL